MSVRVTEQQVAERLFLLLTEADTDDQSPLAPFTVDMLGKRTLLLEGPLNQKFSVVIMEETR